MIEINMKYGLLVVMASRWLLTAPFDKHNIPDVQVPLERWQVVVETPTLSQCLAVAVQETEDAFGFHKSLNQYYHCVRSDTLRLNPERLGVPYREPSER